MCIRDRVPTVSRTGKGIEDLFHVVISIYEGADFLAQKGKVRAEAVSYTHLSYIGVLKRM